MNSVYLESMLKEIPRLLGLVDKNPSSPTFGCFDRQFWHYNVVDFPCARFQEAVLTLAILYQNEFPDNAYYKNSNIFSLIDGALRFWSDMQDSDGSFSEWYPVEHSFVATAFTTYAISETLLILGGDIPSYKKVLKSLRRAGEWLLNYTDFTACNQVAGAVTALFNLYLLTSEERYRDGATRKLEQLKDRQNPEGWFPEYGGPDTGYLSLAIDYLSKYYEKSEDPLAREMIDRALGFLVYFAHPNGTFGGEYGSRNTKYIIPAGVEFSSRWNKDAGVIASLLRESLGKMQTVGPYNLDDRYLSYTGYTYLQAHMNMRQGDLEPPMFEMEFVKFLPNSGILVVSNDNFYFISNLKKGGVFRLFNKKTNSSISDSGVIVEMGGRTYSSGWLNDKSDMSFENYKAMTRNSLLRLSYKTMSSTDLVLSRLFQLIFGRFTNLSLKVKDILRRFLITYRGESNIEVTRYIDITGEEITVRDEITSDKDIGKITVGAENPYIYIPSSRYFEPQDLDNCPKVIYPEKTRVKIVRRYDAEGKEELTYQST